MTGEDVKARLERMAADPVAFWEDRGLALTERGQSALRRRARPFPRPSAPKHTPAGLKPMIDLMQRARDRETYGGATDD